MVKAKCIKCGGSAIADTFEKARNLINHAVALSRGIKCGDNYNCVKEIPEGTKPKTVTKPVTKLVTKPVATETKETPQTDTPVSEKPEPQKTSKQKKTQTNTKETKKQTSSQ